MCTCVAVSIFPLLSFLYFIGYHIMHNKLYAKVRVEQKYARVACCSPLNISCLMHLIYVCVCRHSHNDLSKEHFPCNWKMYYLFTFLFSSDLFAFHLLYQTLYRNCFYRMIEQWHKRTFIIEQHSSIF